MSEAIPFPAERTGEPSAERTFERAKKGIAYILGTTIVLEFVAYLLGLRVIVPFLGMWLAIGLGIMVFLSGGGRIFHWLQIFWLLSMITLLGASLFSYLDNRLGATYVARWFLAMAPAAFLPSLGGLIDSRVIYRAAGALGVQALIYCVVVQFAMKAGLNPHYPSPIPPVNILAPHYFQVRAFEEQQTENERRPVAFAPFATYAGAIGCFYVLLTLGCRDRLYKWLGLCGWMSLVILSAARTALFCTACGLALYFILAVPRRYLLLGAAVGLVLLGIVFQPVLRIGEAVISQVENLRPTSTEVRHNLRQLANDEWEFGEHQFFGTNTTIPGGTVVANMPVGSHDTINATLMIRGVIGISLIVSPIFLTLAFSTVAGLGVDERICASIMLVLSFYLYAESLETLFLFIWPVFLVVGFACRSHAIRTSRSDL